MITRPTCWDTEEVTTLPHAIQISNQPCRPRKISKCVAQSFSIPRHADFCLWVLSFGTAIGQKQYPARTPGLNCYYSLIFG